MFFAVLLPFFAACYIFAAAFLKKKTFAWEIGTAAVGLAFLNIVSMAFNNVFGGQVYSLFLWPFLSLNGIDYDWRLHFETTEIFLVVFIVFCALMSLLFVKDFLAREKMNSFVVFLLGLVSFLIVGIGAKNMFQFFVGWDLSALFAYLLLMLFHEKQAVRQSGVNFLIWHTLSDVPLFCVFFLLAQKTGSFLIASFDPAFLAAFQGAEAVVFAVLILLSVSAKLFLFGTNIFVSQTAGICVPALSFIAPTALGGLGVYVLYIFFPFVEENATVRTVFIVWGALTAVAGLLTAAVQTNIKVLLCQLLMGQFGFVLTVFGLIGRDAAFCAYIALITPMTGLILCAGTVIQAMQSEEDLSRMGGLKKYLPFSFWSMTLFCVCCVGFPQIGNSAVVLDMYAVLNERALSKGGLCLTMYLFALAFVFSRLLFKIFLAEPKFSPTIGAKIKQPSKIESLPLMILLLLSFFQNKVFEQSVLPDLSAALSLKVVLSLLIGACGLPVGIYFFKRREQKGQQPSPFVQKLNRFCLKGFYLTDFYQVVFVRSFMALAEFAWRFAGSEMLTENLPKALKKAAEKLQKTHSGKPSDFLVWSLAGLFAMIFSLMVYLIRG